MAIDWALAGKIAMAAAQAFMSLLQSRKDDEERERDRELIIAAIEQTRDQILDRLNLLEVDQLRGELEGFQLIYASYDPDPNDPVEEGRLVSLINDSARVLGRIGAHLDALPSNPDLALEAWAVYVPLLFLRAQAMAERETTYGAQEAKDALLSFDMALPRLAGLLAYLRAQSDSRFGPIVCKPVPDSEDRHVCWYWWRHSPDVAEQYICGSTRDPRGVEKCQKSRTTNMENAYQEFPGVAEITAASNQVQDAREALDALNALDLLKQRGINVGEVMILNNRVARASRPSPELAMAVSEPDWFS
jgi:hypothetical protein